jgi:hypothetical protein
MSNRHQSQHATALALKTGPAVDFRGYRQRHKAT